MIEKYQSVPRLWNIFSSTRAQQKLNRLEMRISLTRNYIPILSWALKTT